MPSTHHSHIMELQLQKISEHIHSTNSLYHSNYKKRKQSFIQLQHVSAKMAVVMSFDDGSLPQNTFFSFSPQFFNSIAFQVD